VFGESPGAHFEGSKVDRILSAGEKVSLGGTELVVHLHPGHTKGAMSFTTTVAEGGRTYRVAIVNLGSVNDGVKVSGMPDFPGIEAAYRKTFREQKAMALDVWFASHAGQFALHRKYQPGDAYDPARWVDPEGFQGAVARMEALFNSALQRERSAK
jgi:metallo-beta-lactamase class B